jgi:hypothetical protein
VAFVVGSCLIQESAWATELPILHVAEPGIGANMRHLKNKNGPWVRFCLFLCGAGLRALGRGPKTSFFRHQREQSSKGRETPRSARRTSGSMIYDFRFMMCKTNPISGDAAGDAGQSVQNEPNFTRRERLSKGLCKTKPNLGRLGYMGKGGRRAGCGSAGE